MEESTQIEQQKFTINSAFWVAVKSQLLGLGIMIIPMIILSIIFKEEVGSEISKLPFYFTIMLLSTTLGNYIIIRKTMKRLKIKSFPIKNISTQIVLLIIIFVIFGGIIIGEFSSIFNLPNLIKWQDMSKFDLIIGGVILAPILEELLYRGLILEGLLKTYSPQKAIVFSAIIFGLIHFNPAQIISASLTGLFLGWIYYKSGSILPSIIAHFFNNLLAFLPFFFSSIDAKKWEEEALFTLIGNVWLYVLLIVSSIVIVYFIIRTIDKKYGEKVLT